MHLLGASFKNAIDAVKLDIENAQALGLSHDRHPSHERLFQRGTSRMSENVVIANQKHILQNQKLILTNQNAIKANQATIKKNQASILKNQAALNMIVSNQKKILAKLK